MPAQQQHTSYTGYTSSAGGPITAGQCVVLDADGDYYNVSSSAARAAAVRRSTGIAVTSCSGTAQDRAFEVQVVGEIDSGITGLGAGTSSVIRVSSAGVLERVASYSSSDDVVGYCDADGTAHVCFPLAGLSMAIGAAAASAPTNSLQVANADGTFRGLTHASGSADGYIETRSAAENVATFGHWRTGNNAGAILTSIDAGGTPTARSVIGANSVTWTFGNEAGWNSTLAGVAVTIKTLVSGVSRTAMVFDNGGIFFNNGAGAQVFEIYGPRILSAIPRHGQLTAWGASEGSSEPITGTGSVTVTVADYALAHNKFLGSSTGTYTYPRPGTATGLGSETYFKWLEEAGGYDRIITVGTGITYTLKANTSAWVMFTRAGVYGPATSSGDGKCTETFYGLMPASETQTELTTTGTMTVPESGYTLRSISIYADDTPASGCTYTITVYVNGIATALAVVATAANIGITQYTLPSPIALTAGHDVRVYGLPDLTGEPGTLGISATVGFGVAA